MNVKISIKIGKTSSGIVLIPILLSLLFNLAWAQNGFSWKSFKPEKAPGPVKVEVMGKRLNYYPLEKGDEIFLTLEGPTKLRILMRIEFGEDPGGEKSYYLRCERDGETKNRFRRVASASSTAVLADEPDIHMGSSRNVYLKVPSGKHTYRFYVGSKSTYRLYLRFYERSADVDSKSENVAFAPADFTREVPLIIKEDEVTYYRIGSEDSLKFSVIGPTTIKVLSRLEFAPNMFTNQKFRIRVFEDGSEKQVYPLRSKPSDVAEYMETSEYILGEGAKFFIEVPRGKHQYEFDVIDNGRSALLRFFIPRRDLINNL
ncbi:hypothetical protein CEE37_04810 [candidate division LCP-89 bacterium B3_LCP]|uniref:Uncharacterized protein n=1 Tax=candidate division LCP-89 bacterium B3_LCP TaxID=2012998 RepID=A0A532V3W3_UNCL8|nr:MAG: hypothetical protein CEE37_04810 [candidate division LCP-89 bacterium B3_LCP]